ncbi:hypothetical protein [Streptomyces sp. cg2]|uniref:hypothetical protein n=1 Tax=Streptomyces sp. cg2 TaxID=3238799 RepID=UPI0034E1A9B0
MTTPDFRPSHVVPPDGMPTWAAPDAARPLVPLDPLLPVEVVRRRGDWALARCSNGWSAWVDGRRLLSVPHGPPTAGRPTARTADPRPLLAAVEDALARYRQGVEELLAGRLDREAFAERTGGSRIGAVVDGDAVWLYDAPHERWCFCDGVSLETFAVTDEPSADGAPEDGTSGDGRVPEEAGPAGGAEDARSAGGGGGLPGEAEFPPPFPPPGGPGDRA